MRIAAARLQLKSATVLARRIGGPPDDAGNGVAGGDAGIGGDGLRGPSDGFDNPHRQFLAHENSPEVWENGKLISGGKHYGHLEVNVQPGPDGKWNIEATPVHAFPKIDEQGKITWERRAYADVVRISE